jgi:hypothetical protein
MGQLGRYPALAKALLALRRKDSDAGPRRPLHCLEPGAITARAFLLRWIHVRPFHLSLHALRSGSLREGPDMP